MWQSRLDLSLRLNVRHVAGRCRTLEHGQQLNLLSSDSIASCKWQVLWLIAFAQLSTTHRINARAQYILTHAKADQHFEESWRIWDAGRGTTAPSYAQIHTIIWRKPSRDIRSGVIALRLGSAASLRPKPSNHILSRPMDETEDYKRHETLYLSDGNIALVAQWNEREDGCVVFRIHRSILARSSSIFEDMFSLPAGEAMEMYDGDPLVRMQDTGEDLEGLLQYLYNHPPLSLRPYDPDTQLKVRPLLRMADKFQVDVLRDRIVAQLVSDWPQTIRQWDKLESEIQTRPASAIRLARDFNIPEILGTAFYHLSRINIEHDWDSSRGVDKHGKPARVSNHRRRTARWDLLEKEDHMPLSRGRYNLKVAAAKALDFSEVGSRSEAAKAEYPCSPECDAEKLCEFWRDVYRDLTATHNVLGALRVHVEETLDT
ncbi:hypothetical protein EVG20_g7669 [Dentipellis fragilis]|uniref:BTB domain-containing protein n=1 Tax=Dentipellis fragilis TaxID=205917 RepID=A0A4Y9YDF2_9AGAM|nr:hypothetical protein EVG20_g7669 [Dentipellis fragilis]